MYKTILSIRHRKMDCKVRQSWRVLSNNNFQQLMEELQVFKPPQAQISSSLLIWMFHLKVGK